MIKWCLKMSDKISFKIDYQGCGEFKLNNKNIEDNMTGFNINCIAGNLPKIDIKLVTSDGLSGEIEGNVTIIDDSLREELLKFYNSNDLDKETIIKMWKPFVVNNDIVTSMYTIRQFIKQILKLEDKK